VVRARRGIITSFGGMTATPGKSVYEHYGGCSRGNASAARRPQLRQGWSDGRGRRHPNPGGVHRV